MQNRILLVEYMIGVMYHTYHINTWRLRQNCCQFADSIFIFIFLNENCWNFIQISLEFVSKDVIDNTLVLVEIMAWHQAGNKPLSEAMAVACMSQKAHRMS